MNISIKYFINKINRLLFIEKETNSTFYVWRWHIDHVVYSIIFTFMAGIIFKEINMPNYFFLGFAITMIGFVIVKIKRRFWNNRRDLYDALTDFNQYMCGISVPLLYGGYIIYTLIVLTILFIVYFITIKYTSP